MTISVGDTIPAVTLLNQVGDEVREIDLADFCKGRKVVLFGLPGAYTQTCSAAHLPSFIRTIDQFKAKGVDDVACISVNDVRIMHHWGQSSGAEDAGILMLADWNSDFAKAVGLEFTVPAIGFKDRLTRCAMLVEDGTVTVLNLEESTGACDLTAGETLLEAV